MGPKLKPRQQKILNALRDLQGRATTTAIAERAHLHTNGVSQSLGAMAARKPPLVRLADGSPTHGGKMVWEIVRPTAS